MSLRPDTLCHTQQSQMVACKQKADPEACCHNLQTGKASTDSGMSKLQPDVQMSVWTGARRTSCCLRFLPALFFLALSRARSSLLSSSAACGAPCCWVLYTSSGARIAASDATYTQTSNLLIAAATRLHVSNVNM